MKNENFILNIFLIRKSTKLTLKIFDILKIKHGNNNNKRYFTIKKLFYN